MPKHSAVRIGSAPADCPAGPTTGPAVDRPALRAADRLPEDELWSRVTRELADDLAVDALARDRAGEPPFDEVARLREAGLPALLTPPAPGRHGTDWRAACAVIREIAAADGSIGELLGRHYVLTWSGRFFGTPESASGLESAAARHRWLLGGGVEPSEPESGPGLTLTPAGGGYVLNGQRSFAAGATVADRLVVGAQSADTGESLIALVDPALPGVSTESARERLGQRLTGAGSVGFDDVRVRRDQVLGTVPRDEHAISPYAALAPLALQLVLTHVGLGVAEGALAEARDVNRAGQASWPTAPGGDGGYPDRPGEDPYLLLAYGELATAAHAAAAVLDRATEALERGLHAGPELGVDDRADIAVLIAAADAVTSRAAVHITTRVLELTDGTRAFPGGPGFDRFWRNARVLTARSSPAHRLRDVGDHYLNGAHPRLTLRA
ncbi:acyl-CoA dehydrogenase family protein [Streptomyces sp. NPDC018031]|uniref:acyl-CoA dehydrogenase family protein n=1 Tax=Streptomyces sp. NPDC018031 TaxID=3365033 RepID=UPI0037AAC067